MCKCSQCVKEDAERAVRSASFQAEMARLRAADEAAYWARVDADAAESESESESEDSE